MPVVTRRQAASTRSTTPRISTDGSTVEPAPGSPCNSGSHDDTDTDTDTDTEWDADPPETLPCAVTPFGYGYYVLRSGCEWKVVHLRGGRLVVTYDRIQFHHNMTRCTTNICAKVYRFGSSECCATMFLRTFVNARALVDVVRFFASEQGVHSPEDALTPVRREIKRLADEAQSVSWRCEGRDTFDTMPYYHYRIKGAIVNTYTVHTIRHDSSYVAFVDPPTNLKPFLDRVDRALYHDVPPRHTMCLVHARECQRRARASSKASLAVCVALVLVGVLCGWVMCSL